MSFNSNHSTQATIKGRAGNPAWLLTLAQIQQSLPRSSPLDGCLFVCFSCIHLMEAGGISCPVGVWLEVSEWNSLPPSLEWQAGPPRVHSIVPGACILEAAQWVLWNGFAGSYGWNPNGSSQRPGFGV